MNRNATAARSHDKSNGGDKVVRTLRVYASGKVVPLPGRPPKDWASIVARARAHAVPAEERPQPAVKAKDPKKVAAGKARAAQAAARKAAEAAANKDATAKAETKARATKPAPTKKAPAKAAKPAAKVRGGARPGSGPKPAAGVAMVVYAMRVTPEQKRKLLRLGSDWLRARVDAATIPAGK